MPDKLKKAKKVLVTGGAGFIGSHLSEELLNMGYFVYVLDDLSTGRIENIKHLLKNKNFKFKKGSVLNKKVLDPLIKKSDEVYHLAAAVGVKLIMEHPLESLNTNIFGTHNVLEAASRKKIPTLITSSSEAYGKNGNTPFNEHSDRIYGSSYNIRWGYALSKTLDEFLALAYFREKKLPTVTVRLFNTTGPRQTGSYGMVVPNFIKQALEHKPITVHGSGEQSRCFSYVHDIVLAMIALLNNKKAYGEIFNLGSEERISIKDLAEKVRKMTNSKSKIVYIPHKKVYGENFEDMNIRVPDISKAKAVAAYAPNHTLHDILTKTINDYKINSNLI